jgi:LAO/AO transport system kinase
MRRGKLSAEDYRQGVVAGDRRLVAKAITLLESRRPDHAELGREVLEKLVPHTGGSHRVGITGPPGVGKSCLIEALGLRLIQKGQRVAVLAVDPTSPLTGGSILGDKTRMVQLAREEAAFIRPTPSGGRLGGVAQRTREALLICEAAGYDAVIVETVGTGQSETEVASMVDFFAVLVQPGSGDELQGIKKGVLELADAVIVTKADGENLEAAGRTRADYAHAIRLLRAAEEPHPPSILTVSAWEGTGIGDLWDAVLEHRRALERTGGLEARRREQARRWLWRLVDDGLRAAFRADPEVAGRVRELERDVEGRRRTPVQAAKELLDLFLSGRLGR